MLLVVSMIVLVVSVSAYILMYRAVVTDAESAAAARTATVKASADATRAKAIADAYQQTTSSRARLSTFLVNDSNVVAFIKKVESISKQSGATVSISSISSGTAGVSSKKAVIAAVSITGSWSAVMRAIGLVENMPYAIMVQSVRLGGSTVASGSEWSASISLSVLSAP